MSAPSTQTPTLHLHPVDDSFVAKRITLLPDQRVTIGRFIDCEPEDRTAPTEGNGYFDSKVLSRQHAEVWEEGNKVFIRDTNSVNGTFLNGKRLAEPNVDSGPFQLKSDDVLVFGIDVFGEDKETINHHKITARVGIE